MFQSQVVDIGRQRRMAAALGKGGSYALFRKPKMVNEHLAVASGVEVKLLAEDGFVFQAGREQKGLLLFVPSPALTKSGLGPGICRMAFDRELSHFGKFYEVVEELPFSSSVIRELGRRYPVAEVTARGVQLSSEDLRRRLGVKPGGPVHIFACSLDGERRIIVCEKV